MKKNYHVLRIKPSGWAVKREGAARAASIERTQKEAEDIAKKLLKNVGGEVRIHGRDGRIRDSDTIPPANDPNPPKDTKF